MNSSKHAQLRKLLPLLALFTTLLTFGQLRQQKMDSVSALLKNATSDSVIVKQSIALGVLVDTSNPLKAEELFKNALSILEKDYWYTDRFEKRALAYDCLGIIERRRSNYEQAYDYYLKALEVKKTSNNSKKIGRSYHNIAMLFSAQKDLDRAIFYIKKALPLRKKDSTDYGISLNNYGHFLYKKREMDSALIILDSAKLFFGKDMLRVADVNNNIARVYDLQKKHVVAFEMYAKNLEIYRNHEKIERLANTLRKIGRIARKLKKHTLALKYLDQSEVLAKQYESKKLLANIYNERYKLAKAQDDFKIALDHYQIYKKYHDSIANMNQINKIEKLELAYIYKNKRQQDSLRVATEKVQLETMAASQRSQKQLFVVLFLVAVVALFSLYLVYRYKQKVALKNIQGKELEAELLNEKINFLHYRIERLLTDNKMRTDFKEELLQRIRILQTKGSTERVVDTYQSILVRLKNQIETEKRLNVVSEKSKELDKSFELKLAASFTELTKSEREICHLIYLNLSIKEIMNVRNTTLPSIKSARYRIRKKLQVPTGVELELFMQQLL